MIKGNIEIIQSNDNEHVTLFQGNNLTVDGMRETIADVMTYMPNPSATDTGVLGSSEMEVGASSVSGYQVQGMSLGSAKDYYPMRNSRLYLQPQSASGGPNTLELSTVNYTYFTPKTADTFEILDVYSGVGFNQWRYTNAVEANILVNPTLDKSQGGWNYSYNVEDDEIIPAIKQDTVEFSEGEQRVTNFEVSRGQQRVTLTQTVPISPGEVYTLYTHGKAHKAYLDFRVGRGRNGIILEYYDFNTNRFVSTAQAESSTRRPVHLENWWEVNEFKFQLRGQKLDTMFQPNTEYFVQYVFPSHYYEDTTFAPWDPTYVNPYIDITKLELCADKHQILKNPNFLEHESVCMNSDFIYTADYLDSEVPNLNACQAVGLTKLQGWRLVNPLATMSPDPSDPEERKYGSVQPFRNIETAGTAFSGQNDGILIHAASGDIVSASAAAISCTFGLDDRFRNNFAYPDRVAQEPSLVDAGRGQADNNSTLMMSFDTMVSSNYGIANQGYLEISLTRDSDGFGYSFSADSITNISDQFAPVNIPKRIYYPTKETWINVAFPVILPPDANRNQYTLSIKGRGRLNAVDFVNYGIRNFRLGPLAGWRTYVYDQSGVGAWTLSSISTRTTKKAVPNPYMRIPSGTLCSGLSFSSVEYNTLGSRSDIEDVLDNTVAANKNQLVQNFVGMEPTKSYRLAIKGSCPQGQDPTFRYQLKAKSQENKNLNSYNVLGSWMEDAANYSALNAVPVLNPYSRDARVPRRTYPNFRRPLNSPFNTPQDWGILVGASGSQAPSVVMDTRANTGDYTFSGRVFNERAQGAYFNLSCGPSHMFNWATNSWDNFAGAGTLPIYRGSTSGNYFVPLPSMRDVGDFTTFAWSSLIPINREFEGLPRQVDTTPDGIGLRGEFKLTAGIWGSNYSGTGIQGASLLSDLALRGPGVGPNVDIWKEVYYNFDDASWQPAPFWGTDTSEISKSTQEPRSFIHTPERVIQNMCFYGLDRDTEYQLNIMDSSGGQYVLHDISLTDTSLICNKGKQSWVRNANIWTSEPYSDSTYNQYVGGTVIKMFGQDVDWYPNSYDPSNITTGFIGPPTLGFNDTGYQPRTPYIKASGVRLTRPQPELIRSITLGDYDIKGGDLIAFGWEAMKTNLDAEAFPNSYISCEARYNNTSYYYNFNSKGWTQGFERREQLGSVRMESNVGSPATGPFSSVADVQQFTHLISPQITAPKFGPETKLIFGLRVEPNTASDSTEQSFGYKSFKLYRYTAATPEEYRVSGDTYLYPEFPRPEDISLQSRGTSGNPDELGHFLNHINYFEYSAISYANSNWSSIVAYNNPMQPSPAGDVNFEQAVTMGSYLPSAGLWFPSGTFGSNAGALGTNVMLSGTLNQMGVMNSDGYIYRHPFQDGLDDSGHDASAGFIVSSVVTAMAGSTDYGNKTVRYILKVHKDDWKFLDYYMGGIGAMGLHTLDKGKTYNKLGTNYQISSIGASYSTGDRVGLYNVSNPAKNPIFRLSNKKVSFPPGLKIDYSSTDHITIIWDINFVT